MKTVSRSLVLLLVEFTSKLIFIFHSDFFWALNVEGRLSVVVFGAADVVIVVVIVSASYEKANKHIQIFDCYDVVVDGCTAK